MPDTEGVPSTSAGTAESAAPADNIINFPSTNIAFDVGSALDEVMEAYDKRRQMLAVAFKIANLSSAQLKTSFAGHARERRGAVGRSLERYGGVHRPGRNARGCSGPCRGRAAQPDLTPIYPERDEQSKRRANQASLRARRQLRAVHGPQRQDVGGKSAHRLRLMKSRSIVEARG